MSELENKKTCFHQKELVSSAFDRALSCFYALPDKEKKEFFLDRYCPLHRAMKLSSLRKSPNSHLTSTLYSK